MTVDVAIAIDRLARDVSLRRNSVKTYDEDGNYVAGGLMVKTIRAAIQPARGKQLMDLPEGVREEARWLAWSREPIMLDDIIANRDQTFRVMFVWPRDEGLGNFWRVAMGLVR